MDFELNIWFLKYLEFVFLLSFLFKYETQYSIYIVVVLKFNLLCI